MMWKHLFAVAALLLAQDRGSVVGARSESGPSGPGDDAPRAVVRRAVAAVEGDSVAVVRARWAARLRSRPDDREAAFGLATLARLTYAYPDAERRFGALIGDGPRAGSRRADPYA